MYISQHPYRVLAFSLGGTWSAVAFAFASAFGLATRAALPENWPLMADPLIEKLLILQERDIRRDEILRRLREIPAEIAEFEQRIAKEKAAFQQASDGVKSLELKRRDVEQQIANSEEQRRRFQSQQLSVKKNEEYAALDKQIDDAGKRLDELESEALGCMIEIDEAKDALKSTEASSKEAVSELEGHIKRLKETEAGFKGELAEAEAAVSKAEEGIDESTLGTYRYVKQRVKRPPYIVELIDQHCDGCHLKVDHDILSSVRKGKEITRCLSCGRILYQ